MFKTYFNFKCIETKGDDIAAVLKVGMHFSLVIMNDKNGIKIYPDAFHFGVMLDRIDKVSDIFDRLKPLV